MQKNENQYNQLNNTHLNNPLAYHIDKVSSHAYNTKRESFKISNILLIINKRMDQEHETLVEATSKGDYTYWLNQEDIAEIARLEYNHYQPYQGMPESYADFEILGSLSQLHIVLEALQLKIQTYKLKAVRLTTIINLDNLHWVTLAISYKNNNYVAYFVDSKNEPISDKYSQMLSNSFRVQVINLELGFVQQHDAYNCGLWALENAADLSILIDQEKSLNWIINKLGRPRNKEYFDGKRQLFSEKLYNDPHWRERHSLFLNHFNRKKEILKLSDISSSPVLESSSNIKRLKTTPNEKEKITNLLDTFVETFISNFTTRLGIYHLLAKGERLTQNALINELKTGITGALLGASISSIVLSPVGAIPSLVATLRVISSKYYLSKIKAQKITKIFSEFKSDSLGAVLSETAVDLFFSFENQFMQVTDKAGNKVAMEKLAEDAVGRLFNGIEKKIDIITLINKELLEACVLQGPSEKFFDPSVKHARLRISGYRIQDKGGNQINTANLYEKIGLVKLDVHKQPDKFYIRKKFPNSEYGYRRLLDWEKETDGELKKNLEDQYIEKKIFQITDIISTRFSPRKYHYVLDIVSNQIETKRILDKIKNRYFLYSSQLENKKYENKKSIYFNLIKPVENFSGRADILEALHSILISKMTIAIVPSWSTLSISPSLSSSSSEASSGSQLSISGLGGVGKTQLALRYAELYAKYYDHNILWINAETQENIAYSFYKLAKKLQISIEDHYNQKRNLEEITEEVYEYFSDRKSLFIFDNAENYRNLEVYLPKTTPGNKPTLLITSRYTNWGNVATVLSLPVFTDQEAEELIKKALLSNDTPYEKTRELNQLLQGLPLALQQALAYIKLKRNTDPIFSIEHYIELFKIKTKELLHFNFFDFSNDPYLKTVFTTWQITLDKIKNYPMGNDAIGILNIMAYLYPDHISGEKFFYLSQINPNLNVNGLNSIMHLLSTYSMINQKNNQNTYSIHRLVQQVIRFSIENNPIALKKTVEITQLLLWHWNFAFKKDEESVFHYLHFLLYMSEHKDLVASLVYGHPEKKFFDSLILQDIKYCHYFIDLAYLKFPKEKFLKFLGNAISYYTKLGLFFYLSEILNYIEKKLKKNIFSKENIKYITKYFFNLDDPLFKLKRFSTIPSKKENQRKSIKLYYDFMVKIFGSKLAQYDSCVPHSLKRSTCLLPETEQIKIKASKNQALESHFKKIGQVSHYINSALMSKDILSALFQGHFEEVAMNFGLIASSTIFGKLSDSLLMKGKSLVNNAYLLENKKAFKILFNEEISIARKRKFLGKAMQVASPFVAKGTSIFFVYNLKNEIQAYETGNKFILPNLVSNGIIVSVEGLQAGIEGAEFLEIIAGVSALTGPIGEWVTLLTWIGTEAYSANQQLTAIEKYVHLSTGEKFFEFILALLHQPPLEYLQLKATNGERVIHAIDFLKNNTAIRWYIFPVADFKADLCKIRKVFLTRKYNFTLNESNPDELGSDLFCLSAAPPAYNSLKETIKMKYLCHKALGVSYALNRAGNLTLIDLGEGEDEVVAFSHSPTLFLIQNGKKSYIGSDNGNLFNLQGNLITGRLQGGKELDRLILNNFYPENSDYVLLDMDGFLCGKNNYSMQLVHTLFCSPDTMRVQIDQVEQILGRENQSDIFYIHDSMQIIDGYGGKNKEYPDGFFISQYSHQNLQFTLRNNTLIIISLNSKTHIIDYQIPRNEEGKTQIQYDFKSFIQHRFFFKCSLYDINLITAKNDRLHISVLNRNNIDNKFFSILISDLSITSNNNQTKNRMSYLKNLFYVFNDIELKLLTNGHLNGKEIIADNKSIEDKISLLKELANRLEKSISLQLLNNATLSIGHKNKHEIFYINGLFESHLMNNGGENLYIILPIKETIFPLPKITLYNTVENDPNELIEWVDTLDLREILNKYKHHYPNAIISSHVFPKENDLILTLSNSVYSPLPNSNSYDSACFLPWATVQLKNALLNNSNWYQKLDIFLDSIVRNIAPIDDYFWTLIATPLLFTADKNIIVISNQDLGEDTEILILKNIRDCAFFRNETDLILTNTFAPILDYLTIIFHQFYINSEMKKKVLSSTIKFYDQEIIPGFYQNKINHADHFSHFTQVISSNTSKAIRDSYLNSLYIISPTEEKKIQSQPILRHKRQADRNKANAGFFLNSTPSRQTIHSSSNHYSRSNLIDEKERILAIADDYLQKYDSINSKNKSYVRNKNKIRQKNEKLNLSKLIQNQHKANEKKIHDPYKNNHYFFKNIVLNNSNKNKSKSLNSSKKRKHSIELSLHKKNKSNKNLLNDQSHVNKKDFMMQNQVLSFQEKLKLNPKKILTIPKLINGENKFNSKKPNLQATSSYIRPFHFNDTLMFLNFMIRNSLKNSIPSISYDQKLNKTIKKAEKIKDKIKDKIFKVRN